MVKLVFLAIVFVSNLDVLLTDEKCAPMRYDIAFYFVRDVTFSKTEQKNFAVTLVEHFPVGYMQTRFSIHKYGEASPDMKYNFIKLTTRDSLRTKLTDNSMGLTSGDEMYTIEAVEYLPNIFTAENGDRDGVPNYCFMMATDEQNDTIGSKPSYMELTVYQLSSRKIAWYPTSQFVSIAHNYYAVSASDMQTYATKFIAGFPCKKYCEDNYFAYDYLENLHSSTDSERGRLYLLTDDVWDMTCCGVISAWEFYAAASGTLKIGVFRPTETTNSYRVVGYTTIIVPNENVDQIVNYVNVGEKIATKENDKIGWYSSGANMIAYSSCSTSSRADCPQATYWIESDGEITTGDTVTFSSSQVVENRAYALNISTENNTAVLLRTNENETELEINTAIGTKAIYMTVVDPDLYEDFTYEMTGDTVSVSYFTLNTKRMTLELAKKFPREGGGPYKVKVTVNDTCNHTASVELTVGTYNEPPIINNLPYILEISEETKTAVPLFKINVTDATNDEICCTLPFTIPNSFNFELKNVTNAHGQEEMWLYTIEQPAFEYSDIDAYRVFVCCQDEYGSSYSYLILRLVEVKDDTPYVPPDWFFRALILSLTPISLMTLLSCYTLFYTVFWL